jgi:histidine triad (HIT) family protein
VSDEGCLLCEIVAGTRRAELVWSDEEFVAFLDAFPITAGHLVLAPRLHEDSVFDLPPQLYARLFERVRMLSGPVAQAQGTPRTGVAVEGFGVAHAHVHLVPVRQGNDLDPCRQAAAGADELEQAAKRLRRALGQATETHD